MVSTPQDLALATIRKELNFCRTMGLKVLGIVENMSGFVCPHCQHVLSVSGMMVAWQRAEGQGKRNIRGRNIVSR